MKRLFIVLTMLLLVATAFAQNITNAEYFFDKDPGPGNGHPTAVGTPGTVVNFPVTIPINLSPGFHWLGVRVKDENGKWGLFDRRSFYISQGTTDLPIITKAEYFFDNDPGVGNGSPLNIVNTGFAISQIFPVPVPAGMTPGTHLLSIRMRDQAGHWGLFKKDSIIVGGAATISCPANITVSASGGQCTSIVNDIDPVVAPQGTAYTYTLSGSTVASGNGTASGKIFSAGVTTVTYALSSSPTTNCSFSVVVNSAVTPSVSISVTDDTVCSTQSITFMATPINGGSDPAYQWKKNGINVGNGEITFQANGWTTGDIVTVDMTSSTSCASSIPATSNPITITVVPPSITPTVNITASTTSICPGTLVTFTANSVNGGVPDYAWSINGVYIPGSNGNSFSSSTLVNGDKVRCAMTSTLACVTDVTSVSNEIAMTVIPLLTPQLTIAASATSICSGQQVTFTATPVNGGPDPAYEWRLNGNIVDENNNTYSTSTLQNGDVITATLASSLNCASPQAVSSNTITMSVSPSTPAIVNITASATTICSGTAVTFSVTATAAGSAYQWQINGINIPGANSTTYQSSSLQNGDKIKVVMTPSSPCATPSPAVSNVITMTVNAIQIPSVSIDASATAICTGQSVIFTAHPVNAGSNTVYEWTLNNNAVGANSTTFQSSTLANGDIIRVSMATTPACGNNTQAVSNTLTMSVSAAVVPSVTMSASTSSTCPGASVTFNAAPVSGAGNGPSYQWKRNGINIPGATNATYQSSSLSNGDVIRVAMTSSLGCANPQTVLSHDSVTMTISSTSLTPSVNVSASVTSICQGQTVTFTALPTNGGQVPVYQWKLNGNNVGSNSEVFSIDTLENGDVITVEMATSVPCFTVPTATSVPVTIIVTAIKTFYADFDGDGYGDGAASGLQACNAPAGYVFSNSDCNDDNAAVYPGGTEICGNGIDDNCNGTVDENCTTELPQLLVRTYPVKEGDGTYTMLTVEVKLDRPAISQVTVNYATSNANATAGLDYVAASGALTIPVGDSTVIVQLKIIGDVLAEGNESFWINFSNPVNVMLGNDPRGRTMIIDDDKGKPGTITRIKEEALETESIKIPEVAKRNTVWMIPQISNYENEVLIMNVMGQVVSRFSNYRNQTPILNVAIGLYFYHVRIKDRSGRYKYYSGRLLITE